MNAGRCPSIGRCSSRFELPTEDYQRVATSAAAGSLEPARSSRLLRPQLLAGSLPYAVHWRCIDECPQLSSSHVFSPYNLSVLWRDRQWPLLLQLWRPTVRGGLRQLLRSARPRCEVLPSLWNGGRGSATAGGGVQNECSSLDSRGAGVSGTVRDGSRARLQFTTEQHC
jgi:hypothetical protein